MRDDLPPPHAETRSPSATHDRLGAAGRSTTIREEAPARPVVVYSGVGRASVREPARPELTRRQRSSLTVGRHDRTRRRTRAFRIRPRARRDKRGCAPARRQVGFERGERLLVPGALVEDLLVSPPYAPFQRQHCETPAWTTRCARL